MTDEDADPTDDGEPYAVGYGRPPKEHQFKKGHCPNKRGRPKGSKDVEAMVREELSKTVQVKVDGKLKSMPVAQALLRRTLREGIGGSRRAADQGIRLMEKYGTADEPPPPEWDLSVLTDEELDAFERLLAKITGQEQLGHDENTRREAEARADGVPIFGDRDLDIPLEDSEYAGSHGCGPSSEPKRDEEAAND